MADSYADILAATVEAQSAEVVASARAALSTGPELLGASALAQLTGIPASTWRWWASVGEGPPSFKLGRRRLWRRSEVVAWIASQEATTGTGGGAV